jgi:hypothetical protein
MPPPRQRFGDLVEALTDALVGAEASGTIQSLNLRAQEAGLVPQVLHPQKGEAGDDNS